MEMHQLRYFLAMVDQASFTRAARVLGVTQPSLTRAIQKLESDLGGPLFKRQRSGPHLTELGRLVLPAIRASLQAADSARDRATRFATQDVKTLTIIVSDQVSAQFQAPVILAALQDFGDGDGAIDLAIDSAPDTSSEDRLLSGQYDLALLSDGVARKECIDLHLVAEVEVVLAFPPGHRFAARDAIDVEALDGEPMIARADRAYEGQFAEAMALRGHRHAIACRSNDEHISAELVRAGFGVALMPRHVAMGKGLPHGVVRDLALRQGLAVATVAGRLRSRLTQRLLARLSERSKDLVLGFVGEGRHAGLSAA